MGWEKRKNHHVTFSNSWSNSNLCVFWWCCCCCCFLSLALTKLHRLMHHNNHLVHLYVCDRQFIRCVFYRVIYWCVWLCGKAIDFQLYGLDNYRCDTCIERHWSVRYAVYVYCIVHTLVMLPNSNSDHINNETHQWSQHHTITIESELGKFLLNWLSDETTKQNESTTQSKQHLYISVSPSHCPSLARVEGED